MSVVHTMKIGGGITIGTPGDITPTTPSNADQLGGQYPAYYAKQSSIDITEGTLPAGQTSITINDSRITGVNNRFSIYVDTDHQNVTYSSFTFTTGSITIIFPSQATNMVVGVEVR